MMKLKSMAKGLFLLFILSFGFLSPYCSFAVADVHPDARIVALQSLTRNHDKSKRRIKALDYLVKKAPHVVASPKLCSLFQAASRGDQNAFKELRKGNLASLLADKVFMKAVRRVFGDGKLEKALARHTEEAKPYFKLRLNNVQRSVAAGKLVIEPCFTKEQEARWRQKNAVVFAAALVGLVASEGPCRENQVRLEMALDAYKKVTGKTLAGKIEVIAQVLIDRGMYPRTRSPICTHDGRPLIIEGLKVRCTNHPKK